MTNGSDAVPAGAAELLAGPQAAEWRRLLAEDGYFVPMTNGSNDPGQSVFRVCVALSEPRL